MSETETVLIEVRQWAKDMFLAYDCGHDFFNAQLLKLIGKSDGFNRPKLASVFPLAVMAYELWHASETPKKFFECALPVDGACCGEEL